MKHGFDYFGSHRVNNQLVAVIRSFQISIGCAPANILAVFHGLPLLGFDFSGNIHRIGFVNHIPQRNDDTIVGIVRGRRIVAVIHGNKADFLRGKVTLDIIAGVYNISPQPGQIFYNDTVDKTRFNIGEHLLEAGTLKVRARCAIVNVGLYHNNLRVLLQIPGDNQLLGFNRGGVSMFILNGKPHINSGAARGIYLRCRKHHSFFSAFSCHKSSHLSLACLLCQLNQLDRFLVFILVCKGDLQFLFPNHLDALYHVNHSFAVQGLHRRELCEVGNPAVPFTPVLQNISQLFL